MRKVNEFSFKMFFLAEVGIARIIGAGVVIEGLISSQPKTLKYIQMSFQKVFLR